MWKTYKIMRKMTTGTGKHGDIIDLRNYSNGVNWKNTNICIGINNIGISKETSRIITDYNKIDDNRFEIIAYTDNVIYENKVEDTVKIVDTTEIIREYIGNNFLISSYIYCHVYKKGGYSKGKVAVEIYNNANNLKIDSFTFNEVSEDYGHISKNVNKKLEYNDICRLKVILTSIEDLAYTEVYFSIYGGTKKSGDIIQGKAEWLAYEN